MICAELARRVNRSRCRERGDCPRLWYRCNRSRAAIPCVRLRLISAGCLLARDFRVAISGTIGLPLGCAFRDVDDVEVQDSNRLDSNRLPETRLWRGTRGSVAASFLCLDEETSD